MEPEDKVKKKKKNTGILIIGTVFVAIIIILLIFLMQGKTTTSGNYPENMSDEALSCEANNIDYPIFTYDNAIKKEAKVNILFSKDKIKSISLSYSLYYNDEEKIIGSEAHNHAAMNISFGKNSMGADALNANYAKLEDKMRMSLYASGSDITTITLKYFLINTESIPDKITDYEDIYKDKGFKCETSK